MKTLTLVRHAKSTKSMLNIRDIDRPLHERGYEDAYAAGQRLAEKKFAADLLISSPAVRAFSTALIFADRLSYHENKIQLCKNLYETSADDYITEISEAGDSANSVMLFGHNPSISEALTSLLKKGMAMGTSDCAVIKFEIDSWKNIFKAKGELVLYISPKD
jgi:phosphohistidine phosphatase